MNQRPDGHDPDSGDVVAKLAEVDPSPPSELPVADDPAAMARMEEILMTARTNHTAQGAESGSAVDDPGARSRRRPARLAIGLGAAAAVGGGVLLALPGRGPSEVALVEPAEVTPLELATALGEAADRNGSFTIMTGLVGGEPTVQEGAYVDGAVYRPDRIDAIVDGVARRWESVANTRTQRTSVGGVDADGTPIVTRSEVPTWLDCVDPPIEWITYGHHDSSAAVSPDLVLAYQVDGVRLADGTVARTAVELPEDARAWLESTHAQAEEAILADRAAIIATGVDLKGGLDPLRRDEHDTKLVEPHPLAADVEALKVLIEQAHVLEAVDLVGTTDDLVDGEPVVRHDLAVDTEELAPSVLAGTMAGGWSSMGRFFLGAVESSVTVWTNPSGEVVRFRAETVGTDQAGFGEFSLRPLDPGHEYALPAPSVVAELSQVIAQCNRGHLHLMGPGGPTQAVHEPGEIFAHSAEGELLTLDFGATAPINHPDTSGRLWRVENGEVVEFIPGG